MTDRRFDLDWLRITAFGLLILYHCGMFYVTWGWHVKSRYASDAIEPLMLLTSPPNTFVSTVVFIGKRARLLVKECQSTISFIMDQ